MKAQVFLQSELLTDIEVLEIDRNAGHVALYEACLARLGNPQTEEFFLFVEDDDEEQPFEKMPDIRDGLRVHLHRLKGIDVVVRYAGRDVRRAFRPSATVGRVKNWVSTPT